MYILGGGGMECVCSTIVCVFSWLVDCDYIQVCKAGGTGLHWYHVYARHFQSTFPVHSKSTYSTSYAAFSQFHRFSLTLPYQSECAEHGMVMDTLAKTPLFNVHGRTIIRICERVSSRQTRNKQTALTKKHRCQQIDKSLEAKKNCWINSMFFCSIHSVTMEKVVIKHSNSGSTKDFYCYFCLSVTISVNIHSSFMEPKYFVY